MSTKLPIIPEPKGLPESKKKLDELLDINHRKYDIVYGGFRANHNVHAMCSLYALGATPEQIEGFYNYFSPRLEPLVAPKFKIDERNWESHIGERSAYPEYLDFFERQLKDKDLLAVFKKYIPRLIPGLIAAAIHPLIHLGYAIEFNSKLVMAEALAYACIAYNGLGNAVDQLDNSKAKPNKNSRELLKSIDLLNPPDILHEEEGTFGSKITKAARMYGPQMLDLMNQWEFDPNDSKVLYEKTVDLTLACVLAFCNSYREVAPDFFYLHGLTGNHAIRTMLPHLEPKDQRRLLQVGFLTMIALYFTRGPVEFDENFVYKNKHNSVKTPFPSETLDWKELIQNTNDSTDDHLIKVVRVLDIIQRTIVEKENPKFPPKVNLEGARLALGTIHVEDDWFETPSN